jgi:hypothetical protein
MKMGGYYLFEGTIKYLFFFLFSFLVPYSGVDEAGLLGSQGVFFP